MSRRLHYVPVAVGTGWLGGPLVVLSRLCEERFKRWSNFFPSTTCYSTRTATFCGATATLGSRLKNANGIIVACLLGVVLLLDCDCLVSFVVTDHTACRRRAISRDITLQGCGCGLHGESRLTAMVAVRPHGCHTFLTDLFFRCSHVQYHMSDSRSRWTHHHVWHGRSSWRVR